MSPLLRALEPLDKVFAARVLLFVLVLAMTATAAWEVIAWIERRPGTTVQTTAITVAVALVFVALGAAIVRAPERMPPFAWAAIAILAPFGTAAVALVSRDSTTGAQFPIVYAVVYAASQFRRTFAWAVTALAVGADAVIVLTLLEPAAAARDLVVVAVALTMITVVLQLTSERQYRLMTQLDELATTDALTGLSTRRVLDAALASALVAGRPGDSEPHVGLVLVDLDHFKQINDRHGHPVGDAALVQLAVGVRGAVGPADVVARLGGDELAVLVRGHRAVVADRAAAVHRVARATTVPDAPGIRLTVSVGYATARAAWTAEDLYRAADLGLYAAKADGRDRVRADADVDAALDHSAVDRPRAR